MYSSFKPTCSREQYDAFWELLDAPADELRLYSAGRYVKPLAEAMGRTNRRLL